MYIYRIDINNYKDIFLSLGADSIGVEIMSKKADTIFIKIDNLKTPGANILKQEALSIGAECVTPRGVITCERDFVSVILIINKYQLKKLINKLSIQPFLKTLSIKLKDFLNEKYFDTKIMGVLNINNDSFYNLSRVQNQDELIKKIEKQIKDGADIIDIGAVSSRPGSVYVGEEEEFNRLKDVFEVIKKIDFKFSIDSFSPKVIKKAIEVGVDIINDITGLENDLVGEIVAKNDKKIVIMHKMGETFNMQDNPTYKNVILDISEFFEKRIEKALSLGIKEDNIILDVGIGFGKTLEHNLSLINNLKHFKKFQKEILIGASRKSLIDKIDPSKVEDRLAGTLAIHLKALENGANIIRCHDVYEHKQAIKVIEAIRDSL